MKRQLEGGSDHQNDFGDVRVLIKALPRVPYDGDASDFEEELVPFRTKSGAAPGGNDHCGVHLLCGGCGPPIQHIQLNVGVPIVFVELGDESKVESTDREWRVSGAPPDGFDGGS